MNARQFILQARGCPILVVGDLMLDEYLWGNVERISPEAPVQVVDVVREDLRLGGAGNVTQNLSVLGSHVSIASVVGDDEDGELLMKRLAASGVDSGAVLTATGRRTARKTRVLAGNQQMLRIDRESRNDISADQESRLLELVLNLIPKQKAVLISDYGKGVLTNRVIKQVIAAGRKAGVPVLVDPKGSDYNRYRGATLLTPNRKEASLATGIQVVDETSVVAAGRELIKQCALDALVLTRSEEGMSVFRADGAVTHLQTRAREVFDVSGAGDTVLVFVGLGLAIGLPLEEAAALANVAAGVVVGKVGTSTVTGEEFLAAASDYPGLVRKIRSVSDLASLLAVRRARGEKVVFTNGCFDLLHVGHVHYLQQARRLGDLLVVGLNSDASIRRLKGEKRPLLEETERAQMLAALDCIDYITVFEEDTPMQLLKVVRPDVLVKGGDYTMENVVGREFVESYGGRVELIKFVDGKSTTNIIEKVLERYREEA